MTNQLQIKGQWNDIKGRLKKAYSDLTDEDLHYKEGREDELYGRLQKKLGKSQEELDSMLNKLLS